MKTISEMFDLKGRTAIVTGASYGLGVGFAQALHAQGANVVLAARSAEKLEATAKSLGDGRVLAVPCDVGDVAQVEGLMRRTVERFGRIDVLVNNAGIVADRGMLPERIPDEAFAETIRVNVVGVWNGCRRAAPYMLAQGRGSIINVASVAGLRAVGNMSTSYQASKAGVIHLTRNLASSWADRGVRVNALAPGWFPSEMTSPGFAIPVFKNWVENRIPMRRIGNPEELAPALLFLASDASSYVTGQTLVIDGGIESGTERFPDEAFELMANAGLGELARPIKKGNAHT